MRSRVRAAAGSGISQTSENPCAFRPAAELKRARSFSIATIIVSSTIASSPRCASREATISSVTVSGVVDIASAYPSTSRSTRREDVGLAPPHHLADLLQVHALAVRQVVAEVQAPRAADGRGGGRLREHREVPVEGVELRDLLLEREHRLHDLAVVPQDVGVVGHLPHERRAYAVQGAAVETGDGGLRDAERAGHGVLPEVRSSGCRS